MTKDGINLAPTVELVFVTLLCCLVDVWRVTEVAIVSCRSTFILYATLLTTETSASVAGVHLDSILLTLTLFI